MDAKNQTKTLSQKVRRNLGELLDRARLGWRMGSSFEGSRNVYSVYGYKDLPTTIDMMLRYKRQDIASRIVDAPADALWGDEPSFDDASVQKIFTELNTQFAIWNIFLRLDRLAAMSPYSALLIGTSDVVKAEDLQNPITENTKITYLQPYSALTLQVKEYDTNANSNRYMQPLYYGLNGSNRTDNSNRNDGNAQAVLPSTVFTTSKIHWSRVVHVAEDTLEDTIFGVPRLLKVYNLLDDLLKVAGGSAEVYWMNSRGGMQIDVDKEMSLDPEDEENLTKELDEYTNNLRRFIRTRGVTARPINMTFSSPKDCYDIILDLIAASTKIPRRVLIGSEAGQLASQEDRANWAGVVQRRRKTFAVPLVIAPFIQRLQQMGIAKPDALTGTLTWPEAFKLSPLERAQTSAQQARSAANLWKLFPETSNPLISKDEARDIILLTQPKIKPENV